MRNAGWLSIAKFRGEGYPQSAVFLADFASPIIACLLSNRILGATVEYKQLIVKAFEQSPGKWRASVKRSDGKPLMIIGRAKLAQFITGLDSVTANDALLMAIAAIDAGAFSCRAPLAPASSSPSSKYSSRSLPPAARLRPSTVAASTFPAAACPGASNRQSAYPVASFMMKLSSRSSTDRGGGEAARRHRGIMRPLAALRGGHREQYLISFRGLSHPMELSHAARTFRSTNV